jgi:hypothetical protein
MARHIEYGYVVETAQPAAADRVLVTGDASQLAKQPEALTRLSPRTRDLFLYTSDSRELAVVKTVPGTEIGPSLKDISPGLDISPATAVPEVDMPEFGLSL